MSESVQMFFQYVLNGLVVGSGYTLVALGLTIIFSVMFTVNFAHGEIYMIGAFFTYFLTKYLNGNYILAMLLSMLAVGVLGAIIERLVFNPLSRTGDKHTVMINQFLVSFGLVLFLQYLAALLWGADARKLTTPYDGKVLNIFGVSLTYENLIVLFVTVVLIVLLYFLIQKTRIGMAMRAVSADSEAAELMGIDIKRISMGSFALGSILAAAAGSLLGPIFLVAPAMGSTLMLKVFVVIILGGMGSIGGAIAGGIILGLTETLGGGYFIYQYKDAIGFLMIIIVLLLRPQGLFGRIDRHA